ncbi:MAG: hypothetical protein ACRDKS_05235 [Actinomycetota bacterium]
MSAWKAALISAAIGLAIAAGVFAGFGLPGTLKAAQSESKYAVNASVGDVIHVGLGPFHPSGPREIKILSVSLQDPSPAIQLDSIRITLFNDPNTVLLGSDVGEERPDIDALPLALGRVLQPGEDGGFWITFRVNATGDHTFKGVRVTYKSGWLTKTVIVGPNVRARIGEQRGPGRGQGRDRAGSGRTRGTPTPG